MTDVDNQAQSVALFRYGLIADLAQLKPRTGLYARIREKAAAEHTIPGSTRTRVAAETIRDWLKRYRRGGFDALMPRRRADRGRARAIPEPVAELLCSLKEQKVALSVRLLISEARATGQVPPELPLPPSTVHRLLARAGLMKKKPDQPSHQDRRRFAFAEAGELWMSDVMHGPTVLVGERVRRKSYLIAFIDDATRVVPYCAFALSENTQAFLPVLKQALVRRGQPARLFVDNGANFRSHHLALVCAKLGVALIHARPYQPQGKGKIERWFRTVRAQLLPTLTAADTASLEALNRRLWAWVEGEYHHCPHRGLDGETPLERWAKSAAHVRYLESGFDLDELFLFEVKRRVQKDRTVSLNGVVYEVDAVLVGETVTLRFDPHAPPGRPVQLSHAGKPMPPAKPLDAYANCFVKRQRPSHTLESDTPPPEPPRSRLALRDLNRRNSEHDAGVGNNRSGDGDNNEERS
jgi:transposase InsO family protein